MELDPATYPSTRRDEAIIDNYHGVEVPDPYRWLEDPDSSDTKEFVNQLNNISSSFLEKDEDREKIKAKLTELMDFEKYGATSKHGEFYYYLYNSGLQNHSVMYQSQSLAEKDVNNLSEDGTTALTTTGFSQDGTHFAYGVSEKGSDWVTVKFKLADGTDLPDVIDGVKHSKRISCLPDNSGVFYSSYPDHQELVRSNTPFKHAYHSVYFHKLGTNCDDDVLVFDQRSDPDNVIYDVSVTGDGQYLIINVTSGAGSSNMLFCYDLNLNGYKITGKIQPLALFDTIEVKYEYVSHDKTSMLLLTNKDAPMFRLVSVDFNSRKMTEIIAENSKNKINWVKKMPNDKLLVAYLEDVKTTLYIHSLETGNQQCNIPLPIGTVSEVFANKSGSEVFLQFESFTVPGITYYLNVNDNDDVTPVLQAIRESSLTGINASEFSVEQHFYYSKDQTKVPMFVISNQGVQLDGTSPTMLEGYGGFGLSRLPKFSIYNLVFVKYFGGVFASANIRGGEEYGETWHKEGMLNKKQNVFDDFIAAAEFLVSTGYTNPSRLAINGGSNGGLLVAVCSQQRPNLFGVVINRVGLLDMLRFPKFTIGGVWIPEYGDPENKDDYAHLYSPLHNIIMPSGGQWPSTLLMTADHDDRVVPAHTLKYIATLIEAAKNHAAQKNPLLARVDVSAGHGQGKPTSKLIEDWLDIFGFLQLQLNTAWND